MSVLGEAASSGSQDYTGVVIVVMAITALGGWFSAWVSRRNSQDATKAESHQSGVEEFGIVGNLAEQMADRMFDRVSAARVEEQHDCDEKIAGLRTEFDSMKEEMRTSIAECHSEREEFKSVLVDNGLLPNP